MNEAIVNLQPEAVWRQFAAIAAIPRCSKHESAVRDYVIGEAKRHDLPYKTDAAGNVVISRPARRDDRRTQPIVLQGHLDMVCEKNMGTTHDFSTDPIRLVRDGDWLRADNTTLGADNGIAVSMMLALLELDEPIGPVECLFTIDEETGLTGALELDPTMITGKRLINLDTEEEGFFCIGCAGGKNTYGSLPLVWQTPSQGAAVEVRLTGLQGGHSGAEIHLERGNSVVLGARLLAAIRRSVPSAAIAEIAGGDKHNAIPREFRAILEVGRDEVSMVRAAAEEFATTVRRELGEREKGLSISVVDAAVPERTLDQSASGRIIDLLIGLPHGVLGMSHEVPGLVETSTNLAAVSIEDGTLKILTSQRSSQGSLIEAAADRVGAIIRLAGGDVRFAEGYPAWPPKPSSPLVDTAVEVYRSTVGVEPEVGAFHAGLECGVIGDKVGEMDMISFGPDMKGVHTPEERLSIPSTVRTWKLLVALLKALT